MTNKERWDLYVRDLPSAQSFKDFGYYFLINACLQRRVWYGNGSDEEGKRLYPNLYIIFVGPPGCGKGVIISAVSYFLKHHKYERGLEIETNTGKEKPPLFAVGADSITFEELLDDIASNTRAFLGADKQIYIHSSYVFALQELDSLFRKKGDDVARFLKNAYDCVPYDRKTKHQGKNLLRRLCLSLIAGTQEDFIREATTGTFRIFGQGFSSRSLFLYEHGYSDDSFHISNISPEQAAAREELLVWIKRLALVYGELTYSKEVHGWLEDWYKKKLHAQRARASVQMQEYYARKRVNLLKLAAGVHYSEALDNEITLVDFQKAVTLLDAIEPNMEAGFNSGGRNANASYTKKILEYIKSNGSRISRRDLLLTFTSDLTWEEIESCIKELEIGHNLKTKQEGNEKVYYL